MRHEAEGRRQKMYFRNSVFEIRYSKKKQCSSVHKPGSVFKQSSIWPIRCRMDLAVSSVDRKDSIYSMLPVSPCNRKGLPTTGYSFEVYPLEVDSVPTKWDFSPFLPCGSSIVSVVLSLEWPC